MTTFKDVLCLLAIFIAYGIAGRMDYDDALRLEQIRQQRRYADCLTASTPVVRDPVAQINDLSIDPSARHTQNDLPENGQPCARRVL